MKHGQLWIALVVLFTACSVTTGPPTKPSDENLGNGVFAGASLITVGVPSSNCHASSQPTFTWKATGKRLVYVGVFIENMVVADGKIANTGANVWAWHSGMATGREGNVTYQQGVNVQNGQLLVGTPLTPLPDGQYVWAVWAWDDEGRQVVASSSETFFVVDSLVPTC